MALKLRPQLEGDFTGIVQDIKSVKQGLKCGGNNIWKKKKEWQDPCIFTDLVFDIWSGQFAFNPLTPGSFEWYFGEVIFKLISVTDGWGISCETAVIWMSLGLTNDYATLVQVMAWCRQATSYYLSQCWPRSVSPFGVTRPQWVDGGQHIFNGQVVSQNVFENCTFKNTITFSRDEWVKVNNTTEC